MLNKEIVFKTDVKTLSKVFQTLESFDFTEIPVFGEDDQMLKEFTTSLILTIAQDTGKLNNFFGAITGQSLDFSEESLDDLCEVSQNFFEHIPERFKGIMKTMIDAQSQRKDLVLAQMKQNLDKMMEDVKNQLITETAISDPKLLLEKLVSTQQE